MHTGLGWLLPVLLSIKSGDSQHQHCCHQKGSAYRDLGLWAAELVVPPVY